MFLGKSEKSKLELACPAVHVNERAMTIERQWNLARRSHRCAKLDRPFVEDEPVYTAVYIDEETDQFERADYCEEGWNRLKDGRTPFSSWKSPYVPPPPPDAKPDVVEKENPEDLLRRLLEENSPATINARFILAIMLERKRVFEQTDTQEEGDQLIRVYRQKKTDEIYLVEDPKLHLDELTSVQTEVLELLSPSQAKPKSESESESEM